MVFLEMAKPCQQIAMMRDSLDTEALTHTLSQTLHTGKCEHSIQLVTVVVPVAFSAKASTVQANSSHTERIN